VEVPPSTGEVSTALRASAAILIDGAASERGAARISVRVPPSPGKLTRRSGTNSSVSKFNSVSRMAGVRAASISAPRKRRSRSVLLKSRSLKGTKTTRSQRVTEVSVRYACSTS